MNAKVVESLKEERVLEVIIVDYCKVSSHCSAQWVKPTECLG